MPNMASYVANGNTIKLSLLLLFCMLILTGSVMLFVLVVLPSANLTSFMFAMACIGIGCSRTNLALIKLDDAPESIKIRAGYLLILAVVVNNGLDTTCWCLLILLQ
jgi:hypothetical protein